MMKGISLKILLAVLVINSSCNEKKKNEFQAAKPVIEEIVKPDSLVDTLVSVPIGRLTYNSGSSSISIESTDTVKFWRPKKTKIINPTVSLDKLFHAWVMDVNDPHAAFDLTRESLYVVDSDGNGNMPYVLKGDSLIVYYEDEVQRSKIIRLTEDSMILAFNDYELAYVRWRN